MCSKTEKRINKPIRWILAVACMMVIAVTLFPHHHHHYEACWLVHNCQGHNECKDQEHNSPPCSEESCQLDKGYISSPRSNNTVRCKGCDQTDNHNHQLLTFLGTLPVQVKLIPSEITCHRPEYWETAEPLLFRSKIPSSLRAPPTV